MVNFIYDLPILRHSSNKLAKSLLGGWQTSGIVTLESGVPLNITTGGSQQGNGLPNATNSLVPGNACRFRGSTQQLNGKGSSRSSGSCRCRKGHKLTPINLQKKSSFRMGLNG